MERMPTLFLSHGSPMIALEPREAGAFIARLGPAIDAAFGRPRAILAISGHTLTREPALLAAPRHAAVYDFGGFDPRLYEMRYDAPGAPALAGRVAELLQAAGLPAHRIDEGGLDHGIWTALKYAYPQADVPVLPLGWPPNWSPRRLFELGAALAPLADEGVLIVGTGGITHNLRRVFAGGLRVDADQAVTPESLAFRDWFVERTAAADWDALFDYRARAPYGALMHPTDEHLLPFFVAAGAGRTGPGLRIHASQTHGDLGMDAYAFGATAARLASV
ncbi:MAG: dioxygenase [Burkholderiales bacterium]|nr:dioxygenase [Burkholderiales bacterium]